MIGSGQFNGSRIVSILGELEKKSIDGSVFESKYDKNSKFAICRQKMG